MLAPGTACSPSWTKPLISMKPALALALLLLLPACDSMSVPAPVWTGETVQFDTHFVCSVFNGIDNRIEKPVLIRRRCSCWHWNISLQDLISNSPGACGRPCQHPQTNGPRPSMCGWGRSAVPDAVCRFDALGRSPPAEQEVLTRWGRTAEDVQRVFGASRAQPDPSHALCAFDALCSAVHTRARVVWTTTSPRRAHALSLA